MNLLTCGALLEFPMKENTKKRAKVVAARFLSPYKNRSIKELVTPDRIKRKSFLCLHVESSTSFLETWAITNPLPFAMFSFNTQYRIGERERTVPQSTV